MAESLQHKLDRVRRPRVQITYDVETGGAMKKVELPFVVGVLADLSGQPKEALRPFKERKAVAIDRDNFNDVLTKAGVRLAMRVPNTLTDPNSKLAVELNFKHIDDFEPVHVAEQIAPLRELLEMRKELTQLLNRMEGNDKLEQLLESILTNQQKAQALEQFMDNQSRPAKAAAPARAAPAPATPDLTEPEEAPVEESAAEPEPAPVAEEPPPPEEAAADADVDALLASMGTEAGTDETAGDPAAPASQPEQGAG